MERDMSPTGNIFIDVLLSYSSGFIFLSHLVHALKWGLGLAKVVFRKGLKK